MIPYKEEDFVNYHWDISCEEETAKKLNDYLFPGVVFVDIGCQKGMYSSYVKQSLNNDCRVIAIDAVEHPEIKNILTEKDVFYQAILGDKQTTKNVFYRCDNKPKYIELKSTHALDDLIHEKIDIIKLDCDGWEYQILKGASRVLLESRPLIIVENNPDWKTEGKCQIEYLISIGYEVIHIARGDNYFLKFKDTHDN